MICLDMDRKLFLLSKHKLKEAYEQLTGLSLCDLSNLKQLVCALCAQRLINFSRFRDLSLRAHSLMMHLVEQRELITVQHKELMKHATAHLQWDLTHTTLDSDYCDLYIIHTDEEEQTAAEKYGVGDIATVVKTEDSMSNDNRMDNIKKECVYDEYSDMNINMEATSEDLHRKAAVSSVTVEYVKCESAIFECSFCYQDFVQEDTYNEHMNMHLQNTDSKQGASQVFEPRGANSLVPENKSSSQVNDAPPPHPPDGNVQAHGSNIGGLDNQSSHSTTSNMNKPTLNTQMRTHTGEKPYSCETCNYKCVEKRYLKRHMKNHAGEKPFSCEMCDYKCVEKSMLMRHKKSHIGVKPFSCELCDYTCIEKRYLNRHLKTHIDEYSFSCEMCKYKCAEKSKLLRHKKSHTGVKPHSCEICGYKCAEKWNLLKHMKIHTGEKPFSCDACNYKCIQKSNLLQHMRIHIGEK
ncbi:zinc finger protein 782 isoform X2 [Bicyclus anynana]|nr:zinc finger protein 782 isoform X2 [Bicyclus anynana]XP_052744634.1 zinc finger protein 782 isoform X2 [Bicyclus anynana]